MSEDALYLLISYLIYGATLAALVYRARARRRSALLNLAILMTYSAPLLYALNFHSTGGTGLVWLVYLMLALGVHWLVNVFGLVMTFTQDQSTTA